MLPCLPFLVQGVGMCIFSLDEQTRTQWVRKLKNLFGFFTTDLDWKPWMLFPNIARDLNLFFQLEAPFSLVTILKAMATGIRNEDSSVGWG